MNEEEAIKELEHIRDFKNDTGFAYSRKNTIRLQKAIETVLNLLEKKDIDIIETKEANRQLSVELQKKDKIIEEMAKDLIFMGTNNKLKVNDVKKLYERKVENGN